MVEEEYPQQHYLPHQIIDVDSDFNLQIFHWAFIHPMVDLIAVGAPALRVHVETWQVGQAVDDACKNRHQSRAEFVFIVDLHQEEESKDDD